MKAKKTFIAVSLLLLGVYTTQGFDWRNLPSLDWRKLTGWGAAAPKIAATQELAKQQTVAASPEYVTKEELKEALDPLIKENLALRLDLVTLKNEVAKLTTSSAEQETGPPPFSEKSTPPPSQLPPTTLYSAGKQEAEQPSSVLPKRPTPFSLQLPQTKTKKEVFIEEMVIKLQKILQLKAKPKELELTLAEQAQKDYNVLRDVFSTGTYKTLQKLKTLEDYEVSDAIETARLSPYKAERIANLVVEKEGTLQIYPKLWNALQKYLGEEMDLTE